MLWCQNPLTRPKEQLAGAFFGANLRNPVVNEVVSIVNDGIAVALIQGESDDVAVPERAERTFDNIPTPTTALIDVMGLNHFGTMLITLQMLTPTSILLH